MVLSMGGGGSMPLRRSSIAFSGYWGAGVDINLTNFYIEQRYFKSCSALLIVLPRKNERVHILAKRIIRRSYGKLFQGDRSSAV